ncbi:MAG: DNA replication and repair protein RecF [Candidatus Woesebacteria bacterium]|nr:DNA replication and repair protein RecF [Candidatus Woesebacteria bacterium]
MIKAIKLTDFRNFGSKRLEFSDKVTLIIGPNASGKTNILESLFLLSAGRSFKAKVEEEMVNYGKDLTRARGLLSGKVILEAIITRGFIDIGAQRPEKVARKKLLVNGVPKRLIDFSGNLKTVLFGPWDMDLVTESPSLRRKFLDTVLSQVDREYRRSILSYEKGVRQRNRLLFRIREEGIARSQLSFWNQLLIKNGDYISRMREEFIEFINQMHSLNSQNFQLEYDRSVISEGRLEQYKEEEVAAATTLVGPHRDDFSFKEKSRDLSSFGSRGEQRMGILWLKMAELAFVEEKSGEKPTLLLDDIFSELDHEHRDVVVGLTKNQQTIITTADPHFIGNLKKVEKIELSK